MKQIAAALIVLTLHAPPVLAADPDEGGLTLMERGAQLFMEGLLKQVEPTLDDLQGLAEELGPGLRGFVQEMGPALSGLMGKVEDWSTYHAPEILPNGDIILRKKTPEEIGQEAETNPDGSIDL